MKISYVVSVKRIIDTAAAGKEPKVEESTLAEFTGGPDEASAVLASLAERVKSGKKAVGFATLIQGVAEQLKEHEEKAKAEGKPGLVEMIFGDKPNRSTPPTR